MMMSPPVMREFFQKAGMRPVLHEVLLLLAQETPQEPVRTPTIYDFLLED
jgi:hypothetical protein